MKKFEKRKIQKMTINSKIRKKFNIQRTFKIMVSEKWPIILVSEE